MLCAITLWRQELGSCHAFPQNYLFCGLSEGFLVLFSIVSKSLFQHVMCVYSVFHPVIVNLYNLIPALMFISVFTLSMNDPNKAKRTTSLVPSNQNLLVYVIQ